MTSHHYSVSHWYNKRLTHFLPSAWSVTIETGIPYAGSKMLSMSSGSWWFCWLSGDTSPEKRWENHCGTVCTERFWVIGRISSHNHGLRCPKLMAVWDALLYPSKSCFLAHFLALPALPTVFLGTQFLIKPIMRIFISLSFTIRAVRNVSTAQETGFQSCWLLPTETSTFQGMSMKMFNIFLCGKGKVFRCLTV